MSDPTADPGAGPTREGAAPATKKSPAAIVAEAKAHATLPPLPRRLSPVPVDPQTERPDAELLSQHQEALRRAMLNVFSAQKARRSLERQVEHISPQRHMAEGIRMLFDEQGRPPPNAPLEDLIDERRRLEYHIKWFEGILAELKNRLVRAREVEDYALEMLSRAFPDK